MFSLLGLGVRVRKFPFRSGVKEAYNTTRARLKAGIKETSGETGERPQHQQHQSKTSQATKAGAPPSCVRPCCQTSLSPLMFALTGHCQCLQRTLEKPWLERKWVKLLGLTTSLASLRACANQGNLLKGINKVVCLSVCLSLTLSQENVPTSFKTATIVAISLQCLV